MNVPTMLTWLRIALVPLLWWLAYTGERVLFVGVFLVAALTDALDGWLARKLHQESQAGAVLDSVADYVFFLSAIVWLYWLDASLVTENVVLLTVMVIVTVVKELVKAGKLGVAARHWWPSKVSAVVLVVSVAFTALFGYVQWVFFVVVGVLALCALAEVRMMRLGAR